TMTSLRSCTRYPSGGTPPIHIPFCFEAAILSRMRSPMTSRSNCAKDNRTFRVKRPIEVVVLNCCVTETKEAPLASKISTILAKSASELGFVAKYMGDGVLVYFGYPQAHEDDAERAVRAGLGVIDAVGRLGAKSVKLQARVG